MTDTAAAKAIVQLAQAIEVGCGGLAHAIEKGCGDIASELARLSENARSDHPLMGETLGGIESSLEHIADAIEKHADRVDELVNSASAIAEAIEKE